LRPTMAPTARTSLLRHCSTAWSDSAI